MLILLCFFEKVVVCLVTYQVTKLQGIVIIVSISLFRKGLAEFMECVCFTIIHWSIQDYDCIISEVGTDIGVCDLNEWIVPTFDLN